ncbi:DUF2290 domain-containing protein [Arthrobacter sp. G119Y2]|uniref:DUF2290 domain-containing protein n=1 Tax=Arthrobacter sp. G119Y2 TaxID=3134965 RepID=UPI00311A0C60
MLDYLVQAELALFTNEVSMSDPLVSFHTQNKEVPFLLNRAHPGIDQYLSWAESGAYSAMLFDGSLLQATYQISDGLVVGHRLAYIPCPYDVDLDLLAEGAPIVDVIDLYLDDMPVLRSPIRFDYDPDAAGIGHPATHMTVNGTSCRIACIAPLHIHRFADFVFRNFYAEFWLVHQSFFEAASSRHIGTKSLTSSESRIPHFSWDLNAAPV